MSWPVAPVNTLQYLQKDHIEESQKLQMGYYRDLINQYGIPIKYFKHNTTYLKNFRTDREDYIRGENPHLEFQTSAELMAYVQVDNSIVQLTTFGLQTNDNFKVSFLIPDFEWAHSQWLGEEQTLSGIYQEFSADVSGFNTVLSSEYINSDGWLSGVVSSQESFTELDSGITSGSITCQFTAYDPQLIIQPLLYLRNYYDAFKVYQSEFDLYYSSNVDASGNGQVTGYISGDISYNKYTNFMDFRKRIIPQVGDVIRIEIADTFEDLEVTQILDRRPTTDGLNPLLKKYIWQLDCVRREVSHEDMIGEHPQEIATPIDIIDKQRGIREYLSDQEFDYNTEDADSRDKMRSDRIYGAYGNYDLSLSGEIDQS
jgi:hypothetical protein